jgi:hypothetical protein
VRKGNSHHSESHPRLWQALGWRTWEVLVLLATVATMKMFRCLNVSATTSNNLAGEVCIRQSGRALATGDGGASKTQGSGGQA